MAAYADWTYYSGTYLGDEITESAFPKLALRASAVVDQITFNRAADETDVATVDKIKMATCAVAEEIQKFQNDGSTDSISSESVGSYSVSYAENSIKRLTNDERYYEAANLYLGNTGLLFAGFKDGEYGDEYDSDTL